MANAQCVKGQLVHACVVKRKQLRMLCCNDAHSRPLFIMH
jgi:hypothetical protein